MNITDLSSELRQELEWEAECKFPKSSDYPTVFQNHQKRIAFKYGALSPIAQRIAREGYISIEEHEMLINEERNRH